MVELGQSEIAGNLAGLLDDLKSQPVVVCRDGQRTGAIVSMELFDEIKKLRSDRLKAISTEVGAKVAAHAAELGITPELVERLLHDQD